jgi:hypothetical protein
MKELLFGGLLYLAGVVIILMIRPTLMFTEEGNWKEFGIGRNPRTHTWMPFWLFCILWALMSYALITVFIRAIGASEFNNSANENISLLEPSRNPNNNGRGRQGLASSDPRRQGLRASMTVPPANNNKRRSAFGDFEPGYYVLNQASTRRRGLPQYKYYGPEMMEML